jgi:hypothetical protein
MKDNSEDELLDEILGETATTSFRAGSLDQMLAAVRQRRRDRRRRTQALFVALCLLAGIGVFMKLVPKQNLPGPNTPDPLLVHSAPFSPGMIVVTEPLLIGTVNSSGPSVALVEGLSPSELFETIGDDRLFALLAGRPAALVHPLDGTAQLVFLNPSDANGFQIP